jgi:hypothetical protein
MNTLFTTKGELLHKYDVMFKESMWSFFISFLHRIEGYTAAMEQEIHQMIMNSSDVLNLAQNLEDHLTAKYKVGGHFISQFHHYF